MRQMLENPEKLTPAEISKFSVLNNRFCCLQSILKRRWIYIIPQFFLSEEEDEAT